MSATAGGLWLLIEDEQTDARMVELAVGAMSSKVRLEWRRSIEAAEIFLLDQSPRLVLLDLKLSGRSGIEVLSWIREKERTRELPVVVLTGSSDILDKRTCIERGANEVIEKPSSPKDYRALTRRLLSSY